MKVLVSVDMEGVASVVDGEDVRPGNAEYERNREQMTDEASAAVRGVLAFEPDAEVLVADAHGPFRNLLPQRLARRARLIRGKPRPLGMMTGLDDDTDAVVFVGYHGKAGTGTSTLAHTIHGAVVADVRCDGRSLGELGLNCALAAHRGAVPVLVTGDDTVAHEAADIAPGMAAVVVKEALATLAATSLHPAEACARIEAAVPEALRSADRVRPTRFDGRIELEVDVFGPSMTEHPVLVPGVTRIGPTTLRYDAPDFPTAYDVTRLVTLLGGA